MNSENFIRPFKNLDDCLIAIFFIKCLSNASINILVENINQFTKYKYTDENIIFLSNKIQHCTDYPIQFFNQIETIINKIKKIKSNVFKTARINCIFCENSLKEANEIEYNSTVYYYNKPPAEVKLIARKCQKCNANNLYSYGVKDQERRFYEQSLSSKYISFTRETIFERLLLDSITCDIIFKQASFISIQNAYNYLFLRYNNFIERYNICRKRISDAWFYYQYLKYCNEFIIKNALYLSTENLNKMIGSKRTTLLPNFIKKWSSNSFHKDHCKNENCCKTLSIDGNFKCNRLTCIYSDKYVQCEEIGRIQIGCNLTPILGNAIILYFKLYIYLFTIYTDKLILF